MVDVDRNHSLQQAVQQPWWTSPGVHEAGAGGCHSSNNNSSLLDNPASSSAESWGFVGPVLNFNVPTSFTFVSRNTPTVGSQVPVGLPWSTPVAPNIAADSNLHFDFDFNLPSTRTNLAQALHNSFCPQLDFPQAGSFWRQLPEPLLCMPAPVPFNAIEENDPAATSDSRSFHFVDTPTATSRSSPTLVLGNCNSVSSQPTHDLQFATLPRDSHNGADLTSQLEATNKCLHKDDNSNDDDDSDGGAGSANSITRGNPLQFFDMPATSSRKRTRAASNLDDATGPSSSISKRRTSTAGRQTTAASRAPSRPVMNAWAEVPDSDDLFGSDPFGDAEEELKMFDLTKDDVRPGELPLSNQPKEQEDNRVKLARFECIICMDNASNLTVTHCGTLLIAYTPPLVMRSQLTITLTNHRPHVLRTMPPPSYARRSYQEDLPHVPTKARITAQTRMHDFQDCKNVFPFGIEAHAFQAARQAASTIELLGPCMRVQDVDDSLAMRWAQGCKDCLHPSETSTMSYAQRGEIQQRCWKYEASFI